jgi:hypothetical protein
MRGLKRIILVLQEEISSIDILYIINKNCKPQTVLYKKQNDHNQTNRNDDLPVVIYYHNVVWAL